MLNESTITMTVNNSRVHARLLPRQNTFGAWWRRLEPSTSTTFCFCDTHICWGGKSWILICETQWCQCHGSGLFFAAANNANNTPQKLCCCQLLTKKKQFHANIQLSVCASKEFAFLAFKRQLFNGHFITTVHSSQQTGRLEHYSGTKYLPMALNKFWKL